MTLLSSRFLPITLQNNCTAAGSRPFSSVVFLQSRLQITTLAGGHSPLPLQAGYAPYHHPSLSRPSLFWMMIGTPGLLPVQFLEAYSVLSMASRA